MDMLHSSFFFFEIEYLRKSNKAACEPKFEYFSSDVDEDEDEENYAQQGSISIPGVPPV